MGGTRRRGTEPRVPRGPGSKPAARGGVPAPATGARLARGSQAVSGHGLFFPPEPPFSAALALSRSRPSRDVTVRALGSAACQAARITASHDGNHRGCSREGGGQRGRRSQKRRRPHLGPPSGPRPRPIPKWDMWTDARTALLTSSAITYRRGQTAGTGRPWNGAERELALAQCPSRIPGAETIPKGSFRNCGVPHIPRPAGPGVSKRRGGICFF